MVLLVLCWVGGIGGSVGSIFKGDYYCWVGGFCFDTSSLAQLIFFGLKAERENTLNSAMYLSHGIRKTKYCLRLSQIVSTRVSVLR